MLHYSLLRIEICIILISSLLCLTRGRNNDDFISKMRTDESYRLAHDTGRTEADREFAEGECTIYSWGMSRDSYECIDRDTCLYINNISGCTVNPAILGRVEGHNDRILQLIRTRGLPLNSFKRWERELFNIKGYFESKVSLGEHVKLSYSLKPVSSPDKNYSIRSLQEIVHPDVEFANEDEELVDFIQLSIIIHNSKTAASKTVILSGTSKPELCWGPKDSGLLFVYSIDENYQYYDAIDLSKGLLIRRDKYKKLN